MLKSLHDQINMLYFELYTFLALLIINFDQCHYFILLLISILNLKSNDQKPISNAIQFIEK